ncbi:serine/threonine-protein kinase [Streptomyces tendae]|uniref:serine/threonine-protein kinase n=2 Tax=Streptomyces tendae TaxID=1932 RepID=UPI0036522E37
MEALKAQDPARIGAYTLLARLGAGGMGQVYLGRSPGGRLVALKVIRDEIVDRPEAMARFRREVETVGAVRSAYTANLIDASLETAPYWLATEYVAGPTLSRGVEEQGPLPAETCRGVLAALAEGLAAVHGCGVTHRDLKPQNVILAAQGPQLIDFGIARGAGQTALTEAGFAPGTPGYTAPEVLMRNEVGPAADGFALGATLAFAATGRPPFGSGDPAGVSYRAVHEPVDAAGVDPGLAALIEACVAKDPAARPRLDEVIARCGVRTALVEDAFYAALAPLAEAVPRIPAAAPPRPPVSPHDLPTSTAPHGGYGYTPTHVVQPAAPVRRRRVATWAVGLSVAVAVGAAGAFVLASRGDDGDGDGGKGSAAGADTTASPTASASEAAKGGAPAYAGDKLDQTLWNSGTRECQLPSQERAMDKFMRSIADPDHPEVNDPDLLSPRRKVEIGFRDGSPAPSDEPYYVTVSVKPPHDIDPDTGKPVQGILVDNRTIGYLSKPVDLHAGGEPGEWKSVTYPDDFQQWIKGRGTPAIPLVNDPGDWTVQWHHIRTPDDYTSIDCAGFAVK